MKNKLPTKQEWLESGFDVPDEICSVTPTAAAVRPLRTELPDELMSIERESGECVGRLDAARYNQYLENFEATANPYGMDTEPGCYRDWSAGYENAFEGNIARGNPEIVSLPVAQAGEIAKLRTQLKNVLDRVDAQHDTQPDYCWTAEDAECFSEARAALSEAATLRVVVEVTGGCADVTTCPTGVEVEIVDHDNERNAI